MSDPILNADDAIEDVRSKARGRTRYEGQTPFADEMLVQRIDDQAAEIERLKADLELSQSELKVCGEDVERLEADLEQSEASRREMGEDYALCAAQLAEMQAALKVARDESGITLDALDVIEKALASDGKVAADVLAAVSALAAHWQADECGADYQTRERLEGELQAAWNAYRKKGRDDG